MNDCSQVEFNVHVNQLKDAIEPTALSLPDSLEKSDNLHPDVSINEALVASIDKTRLQQQIMELELYDQVHSCKPLPDVEEFFATKETFIKRELLRKLNMDIDEFSAKPAYEKTYITVDEALLIKTFQSGILPIEKILSKYPWIKWHYNKQEPIKSKITCGLCGEHHDR